MDTAQKLTTLFVLIMCGYALYQYERSNVNASKSPKIDSVTRSILNRPRQVNNSVQSQDTYESKDLEYEGDASDEVGNTSHIRLHIKPDFSEASMGNESGNGPYLHLRGLVGGIYQFIEGTVLGIEFHPMLNSCTVYNTAGSYFCTLYRINQ